MVDEPRQTVIVGDNVEGLQTVSVRLHRCGRVLGEWRPVREKSAVVAQKMLLRPDVLRREQSPLASAHRWRVPHFHRALSVLLLLCCRHEV